MKKLLDNLRIQVRENKKRKRTVNTLTGLSALVVFVIVYVLILPAIAMDDETYCGIDAHEHGKSCYEQVLTCEQVEHQHCEDCYDENGELVCRIEEHTHDDSCYKTELVCGKERHIHNKKCYEKPEPEEVVADTEEIKKGIGKESVSSERSTAKKTTEKKADKRDNSKESKDSSEEKIKDKAGVENTVNEAVEANPMDLSALLTDNTGIWHQINLGDGSPVWERVDENTSLNQDEILRIHLAFQLPKGGISESVEDYYDIPEEIGITQETADWLNDDANGINQMITGTATPDQGSVSPEYLAGRYELVQKEDESWQFVVTWDAYAVAECGKSAINVWADMYVTADSISPISDGSNKVVFREEADELAAVEAPYKEILTVLSADEAADKDTSEEKLTEEDSKGAEESTEQSEKLEEESIEEINEPEAEGKEDELTYNGEDYAVSVSYDKDAGILEGAELKVKEILQNNKDYKDYYDQTMETLGMENKDEESKSILGKIWDTITKKEDNKNYARFFDIEIWVDDEKIEPDNNVSVSIKLQDAPEDEDTNLQVVHFGVDGPEVIPLAKTDNGTKFGETELNFVTDEFSVYTVVNASNTSLDGQSFALVSGIADDPGATTGYSENWGQDYFTIIVNAHALSNTVSGSGISCSAVHTWTEGGVSYAGGKAPTWTFESAGNGNYYLYVSDKDGNKKYLTRPGLYSWDAALSDSPNQYSQYKIESTADGTALIYYDGGDGQKYYLFNNGSGEWSSRNYQFRNTGMDLSSSAYRFKLCKKSDAFDSFAARKVSVQNLTPNDSFLIYRKFEDSQGNEQLYALASDGTFVRVYDGGDTLYWRETDKNLYWKYRLEGGYYQIFSTLPGSTAPVYINPMHSEPSQTITSDPSGLTLIGRSNGEYGSALENWDQKAYDYAGLHVTVNDGIASLSTGTRVAGTSDEFLFAVATNMPAAAAETVDTVDSDSLGIKITMFDYGQAKGNYSAGDKLSEMTAVAGSDEYTPHAAHALVKPYLESGLPSSSTNGAMSGLFTQNGSAVTSYKENVNHLFLQSYYDENGMFRYRSEDNYAYLPFDADANNGNGKITGTDFTVYRQAATPYPYDMAPGHTYYTHGHFMPYNDIDMTNYVARLMNQYGNEYTNGNIVGELPVGDGRTYEYLYSTQGIPNFYTGMKLEADFMQPKGGKMDNGDDMIFKFTGDDDMWVYIDGVLVLDIGGIHEPLSGTINFATGKVTNPTGSSLAGEKTLKQIFDAAETALNNISNRTPEQQAQLEKIQSIQWTPKGTFADYTNHDFKAFYMERGAGASNLDIQFNLKVILTNQFVVEKQIPDGVDKRFVNQEYKFRATYKDGETEKPLYAGINGVCSAVVYKDKVDDQGNPVPVPVDNDGYFTLRAGEAAIFKMDNQEIEYNVKEVEVDSEKTEKVEINGQVVTLDNGTAAAAYARVTDRSQLNVKNHPILQNLNIIKHLLPEGTQAAEGDVFEFRVYLESAVEVDGQTMQQLVPYSYGPYYVTKVGEDNQIHYYTLTGENNAPEDKGTVPLVCSTTGRSGSINSIPPEYTVQIPNLAVGTHFYIEERRDNIPAGYAFDHENLVRDDQYDYQDQELGTNQDIISRILARDEKDNQAFDPATIGRIKYGKDAKSEIFNRKLNVNVQKQWLKTNGQPYTLEEARQLPGSTDAVITAELWKKTAGQETGSESDTGVTVTFMVNTSSDPEYKQVSQPVTVKTDSTLQFSLGARGTSQAQEIHAQLTQTITRSSVTSNPAIEYSNGRQKDSWSKYTLSGITENTTVYATFDASKVGDDFVGLYIASMEAPGSGAAAVEEKVADVTLNNSNDWLQQYLLEEGYTYFLMNVHEDGLGKNAHRYTFVEEPAVTKDPDGNITVTLTNKYHEPMNVTVEKKWIPELTSEQENSAYVMVELLRYAKKSKGVLEVVLKDNYSAPIEGAVFKLYKDGVQQEQEYTTDVNGKVTANNLEPGTYYFQQISTPEGYSMTNSPPKTGNLVVKDNKTVPQELHAELQNQALETNGVATLTLLDNNGNPIQGAEYQLRRKNTEEIIKSGLLTDENGKVTVSQLKAGDYYFFELETPDDYNMPITWQNTDFTVLEKPGEVQTFNISMTNDLKGKGTITVSLTGPDDVLISGADFELYRAGTTGTEKVADGTTNANGTLTFGADQKLSAGTYFVHQVTTDVNLLPTATPAKVEIADNGNVNQEKSVSFINPYRGKGFVTVTLTRKDNNNPINGATFELYKDGVLVGTKPTDSNGQLTFGSPVKLSAGNYSIKQTSTDEDLEAVINPFVFTVQENGDSNQTFNWNLQNEENAGNVTIMLWRKGGVGSWNWERLQTYNNLKPGKTYSFTATADTGLYPNNIWYYQDESDHNNADALEQSQLTELNAADWDNGTYHFSITPSNDNMVYSFVLVSGWGKENIHTMTMDEPGRNSGNRNSGLMQAQRLSAVAPQHVSSSGSKTSSTDTLVTIIAKPEGSDAISTRSVAKPALKSAATPATVSPSGPPSEDYITDSSFSESYRIEKKDDWKHVFENLDKYDQSDNLYYYYVVETECSPDSYHVASYSNDNLTDTDTITITNSHSSYSFDVQKVAEGTTSPLKGASFTIQRVEAQSTTSSITYVGGTSPSDPETTGDNGKVSFHDIDLGYYEVKETQTPDGYIITGDDAFYIKIDATGIKLLEKEVKDGKIGFKEASSTKVANVTIGTQGTTVTFTVENTPDVELPMTGGPGTRLFTILGSLLLLLGGTGWMLLKRRETI